VRVDITAEPKNLFLASKLPEVIPQGGSSLINTRHKPTVHFTLEETKGGITPESADIDTFLKERNKYKRTFFFSPKLPHHFLLYFKDRTSVHIELDYFLSEGGIIETRRKISSGNLDADLLVWRYINHWLFLHRNQLPRNLWQTVKIDLTRSRQEK